MITQENVIHSRELAEAEDGFTVAKENGDKYYKDFVIKGIIIPELHKMLLHKLKSKQYSEVLFTILHDLLIKRENIKNVLRYKSLEDTFNSDTTGYKFDKEKFKILDSIIKENLKEIQGKIIFNPNYLSTYEMHKARLASR
ncbi:hypothetical protein [Borrelia sp. RT1S]|nr:hypothetical protein [Borrelia sp. RT1S]UGQ17636.1 hypothetical protein LSO05_04505 [Borrelia sp. RT1S]